MKAYRRSSVGMLVERVAREEAQSGCNVGLRQNCTVEFHGRREVGRGEMPLMNSSLTCNTLLMLEMFDVLMQPKLWA